jgi:hypothetical protein
VFFTGTLLTDQMEENILKFLKLKRLKDFFFKNGPKLVVKSPLAVSVAKNL